MTAPQPDCLPRGCTSCTAWVAALALTGAANAQDKSLPAATRPAATQPVATRVAHVGGAFGGRFYVFGGVEDGGDHRSILAVDVFDPATDRWLQRAPSPRPLVFSACALLDDRFWLVGGLVHNRAATADVLIYDPRRDAWEPGPPLTVARSRLAAVVLEGRLYAIGGFRDGAADAPNSPAVERFDPRERRWRRLADLPTPRHALAVVALAGRIYAIGGYGAAERTATTLESYDPTTDHWRREPDLPHGRGFGNAFAYNACTGGAAAAVREQLFVFGGCGDCPGPALFDVATGQWRMLRVDDLGRRRSAAALVGERAYFFGGEGLGDERARFDVGLRAFDVRAERWIR
ncbi:MAG: Kelch repeat-containing protein [Phycisphaerae bacterium]